MTGHIGAVVTAAGLSSRMGSFKPLLKIGNISAAERVIMNFRTAGIENIVLVTGNKAAELENSLKDLDIVFLRNELYKKTEMFDSVKIGLRYLMDKCDKVFVTPVDVPLFSVETVRLLMDCSACVCIPVFNKKTGHPIVMDRKIINCILDYAGSGGLKDAIANLSPEAGYLEVNDKGILYDMDTQEDYSRILNLCDESFGGG